MKEKLIITLFATLLFCAFYFLPEISFSIFGTFLTIGYIVKFIDSFKDGSTLQ